MISNFIVEDEMKLPILETERLILRVPGPEDAEAMCDYVADNRAHLAPWEPVRDEAYFTRDHWKQLLKAARKSVLEGMRLQLVLCDKSSPSGPILGQCNFNNVIRGAFQAAYLGYSLDHRRVGQGLMYEALTTAIDYCFKNLNLHRIMANYIPINEKSGRLLKRLGFMVEGYARDYLYLDGAWQDHIMTALINDHWSPPPGI